MSDITTTEPVAKNDAKPAAKEKAKPVAKAKAKPAKAKAAAKAKAKPAKAKATKFAPDAKIVVLPEGKENPRRKGTERWKRFDTLQKCKTVAAFLAKHPGWQSTIASCVEEKLIAVR
jgi:hypothetical protein